jgi:hypothetical protein
MGLALWRELQLAGELKLAPPPVHRNPENDLEKKIIAERVPIYATGQTSTSLL